MHNSKIRNQRDFPRWPIGDYDGDGKRGERDYEEAARIARAALAGGADPHLWHRLANKGFATIPKTMPLILKIMDEMTKGAPVSSTYLTLWCSTWDNSFVVLNKHGDMANASGFGGQRGEHTWATRMKKLRELHFIDIKPGKSGPMSNAIIWNPHLVLRWHHDNKTPGLTEASYNALMETALDVGAKDMTEPVTIPAAPAASPPDHRGWSRYAAAAR